MSALILVVPLVLSLVAPQVSAAEVKAVNVTASTTLPPGEGVTYDASNIVDHKVSTVWVEGDTVGSGLGSYLTLDFGETRSVTSITLWNGNWYSWDFFQRHNRIKDLEVEFSDGSVQKFTLKDEKVPETITFPKTVDTSSLKLRIKGIYRGTTFNDTCLAEVEVHDTRPESWYLPGTTNDSGHLPEDADGSYVVPNTYDGLLDTMWCENQKAGDGTGTWIEYHFGQMVTIGRATVRNGNAYGIAESLKSNMATTAVLEFTDGTSESLTLKPMIIEQTLTFPKRTVNGVKVRFTGVKKGTTYNDLCISEWKFAE
jgi:hypothetical protein